MKSFPYLVAALATELSGTPTPSNAEEVKDIMIVHGAFSDSSRWRATSDFPTNDGYNVTLVQNPITSLDDDVAATRRILDFQSGPSLFVGHSYGGMVITAAGDHDGVKGLLALTSLSPVNTDFQVLT